MTPDLRILRILDKLSTVRERRIETFGAERHRFALEPPLAEAEVRALELAHGIELPEAYRVFLREAGASGAGPYYGIAPPAHWGSALYGDVAMPDFAARPCAWTDGLPRDDDTTWARIAGPMDEPFQGMIVLADQGCAYYAALVTTGAERGRVVYINMDRSAPFFPENRDFLGWYERWLDELLWGHKHFWFGMGMAGDEAALVAEASAGERRLAALHAMYRLPALAPGTAELIALRVRDDDVAVRAVALGLVEKFKLVPAIEPHVRRALADDTAGVRVAALRAVIESGLAWHDDARRALADPDETVAVTAMRALDKAKVVTADELVPLIERATGGLQQAVLYAAMTVASPAVFDRLLPIARAAGNDRHPIELLALLAQVRLGAATPAQEALALDLVLERLARPRGKNGRNAEIHGLGAFIARHPRARDALFAMTRSEDGFDRFEAAAALGKVGDADAVPVLRAMLDDATMPREEGHSTAWSVGANAKRALALVEARLARGESN